MVAEVPVWIVDLGKISGAVGASLATLLAFWKLPPVQREIERRRSAIAHEQRTAHRQIVRDVLEEHLVPKVNELGGEVAGLNARVTNLDARLTEHMADEARRFDRQADEVADIAEQVAEHIRYHPGPGPRA